MKVPREFRFYYSSDISVKYKIKISTIEGKRVKENEYETLNNWIDDPYLKNSSLYKDKTLDFYISCTLYSDSKPLCSEEQTSYHLFNSNQINKWDETIVFPFKHQDLPVDTEMVFTIWDIISPLKRVPIGGTSFRIFGRNRIERRGKHKLCVWQDVEGSQKTPGQIQGKDEVYRLEKLYKKYSRNLLPKCSWMDPFTKEEIDKIIKKSESLNRDKLYLTIELPEFEHPVLFKQQISPIYKSLVPSHQKSNKLVLVHDIEMDENPSEQKHHRLNLDKDHKDLKPNSSELRLLANILRTPPSTKINDKDRFLIWRFRYFLSNNKKALTKFLKSVEWNENHQKQEALSILPKWESIDIADSLELLSYEFVDTMDVRKYAVDILRKADDEELLYYLLQLVQAIKHESTSSFNSSDSPLIAFLFERANKNPILGSYLYWYLYVDSVLKTSRYISHYKVLQDRLLTSLEQPESQKLTRQSQFIARLSQLSADIKAMNITREKKVDKLRMMLSEGDYSDLSDFAPLNLPVNPNIEVIGIIPEKSTIYKSAKAPMGLKLKTTKGEEYGIIFKTGDDLRQDQLIIQLISLMDRLLKKENLDLKLTPYKVLATAEEDGIVEMVTPSEAMASVLSKYDGDILKYFKTSHPDPDSPLGISPDVLDTFVKSCAGYCVITYILGIGDRHLDNLLLTPNGNLFHIDFGFILGKDPKIFPPPMKLCKEMVVGMGGENSKHYEKFKQFCCEAYNILRKSSHLILNLFALMIDANIPSISEEKEKSILKVQEKFQLELSDQEAANSLLQLLNDSVSALFPVVVEIVHKWTQYWKA
ncbi:phosphatidylinositol 3-kinase [Tieghemostelium lacteum]|uniref:phosphatidylinositol 3-kinase n=1 Tax=Tieghemostelium lacteum TaxID=361077 RepID=A0A151ZH84_TIELA|nr:phosphatidylinositol 3-kinase [Tieghemostelium lacteum]|eukprot:KYQ93224.1 phosphatidylinositol 3-kinase [Tieghemostelium lacteum]